MTSVSNDSKDVHTILEEFKTLFFQDDETDSSKSEESLKFKVKDVLGRIREACLTGKLENSRLRSLCWKFLFGFLPRNERKVDLNSSTLELEKWVEQVSKLRKEYEKLRKENVIDPTQDDTDALLNNPLSAVESTSWAQYHRDQDLLEEIKKDLSRLFPIGCDEYFTSNALLQEKLQNILFLWSKLHSRTSYRQGMHEIAAPILYILESDALSEISFKTESGFCDKRSACLWQLMDSQYIEHDLFWLFERIMCDIEPLFYVVEQKPNLSTPKKGKPKQAKKPSVADDKTKIENMTPVLLLCDKLQNNLLRNVDIELYDHLTSLGIEPQLYALRWARLIFGREFHIKDQILIWDFLFANVDWIEMESIEERIPKLLRNDAPKSVTGLDAMPLIEVGLPASISKVCLAILIHMRGDLLQGDYVQSLQTLMKCPSLNPHLIIKQLESLSGEKLGPVTFVQAEGNYRDSMDTETATLSDNEENAAEDVEEISVTTRLATVIPNKMLSQKDVVVQYEKKKPQVIKVTNGIENKEHVENVSDNRIKSQIFDLVRQQSQDDVGMSSDKLSFRMGERLQLLIAELEIELKKDISDRDIVHTDNIVTSLKHVRDILLSRITEEALIDCEK